MENNHVSRWGLPTLETIGSETNIHNLLQYFEEVVNQDGYLSEYGSADDAEYNQKAIALIKKKIVNMVQQNTDETDYLLSDKTNKEKLLKAKGNVDKGVNLTEIDLDNL